MKNTLHLNKLLWLAFMSGWWVLWLSQLKITPLEPEFDKLIYQWRKKKCIQLSYNPLLKTVIHRLVPLLGDLKVLKVLKLINDDYYIKIINAGIKC